MENVCELQRSAGLAVEPEIEPVGERTEKSRACMNCGFTDAEHDIRTPLGMGSILSGCREFIGAPRGGR